MSWKFKRRSAGTLYENKLVNKIFVLTDDLPFQNLFSEIQKSLTVKNLSTLITVIFSECQSCRKVVFQGNVHSEK